MAIINEFASEQAYTFHDGTLRFTVLAEKIAGGGTPAIGTKAIFTGLVSAPNEGMEWLFDTMKSPDRETTNLFNQKGAWTTATTQNEVVEERTGDLTFRANATYETGTLTENTVEQKDALIGMLRCLVFDDGNGDKWKVIGTNGVTKMPNTVYNKDIAALTKFDSMLYKAQGSEADGRKVRYTNPLLKAHSKNTLTVMMELGVETDLGEQTVYRFPCVIVSNAKMVENGEANTYNCSYRVVTEAQISDKFFAEGVAKEIIADGKVERLIVGGTSGRTIGSAGTEDVVIDVATGTVTSGTALIFQDGTVIYDADNNAYIAVYDDGGTLRALNVTGGNAAISDYELAIYQFDDNEGKFVTV